VPGRQGGKLGPAGRDLIRQHRQGVPEIAVPCGPAHGGAAGATDPPIKTGGYGCWTGLGSTLSSPNR